MGILKGKVILNSPIYRGNAMKTLFSRVNKSERTPVELPGSIKSPANRMGDAFICGEDNRGNKEFNKLLPQLYTRLFGRDGLNEFFRNIQIECSFEDPRNAKERFYDLRMGIRLNRDTMTMEENANYKFETVFKGTKFEFTLNYPDNISPQDQKKLAYLLGEIEAGRFWFGGGKSKGLGNLKLLLDENSTKILRKWKENNTPLKFNPKSNVISFTVKFEAENPLLVGWSLGHKDKEKKVIDEWMDEAIKEIEGHKKNCDKVAKNGNFNNVDSGFRQEHNKLLNLRGNVLKENFTKASQNDQNLIEFLRWFRGQVTEEIGKEYNRDFRLNEETVKIERSESYDRIFMRMLKWKSNENPQNGLRWEIYIPGSTIKGAFRVRAERILNTLSQNQLRYDSRGNLTGDFSRMINRLFGEQGRKSIINFGDAYLSTPEDVNHKFSSMDSIKINPETGKPVEGAKMDCLFAYGKNPFSFSSTFYLIDLNFEDEKDKAVLGLLSHLFKDFYDGLIPFGGEKTSGMGWIKGKIDKVEILTMDDNLLKKFGISDGSGKENCWKKGVIIYEKLRESKVYTEAHESFKNCFSQNTNPQIRNFNLKGINLVSHWGLWNRCGRLSCNLEVLTPLHIKESGQPSFDNPVKWDFYSISPPSKDNRPAEGKRIYAVPSKTIKGVLRNLYSIITGTDGSSLFGFVEQSGAYMGRVNVSFAEFKSGEFKWYSIPHHYKVEKQTINSKGKNYRVFPHTELMESVIEGINNKPTYTICRCAEKGAKFSFTLDFWNLTDEEFNKLVWCLNGRDYKMGKGKALGLGSTKITINPAESIIWNWQGRYLGGNLNDSGIRSITSGDIQTASQQTVNQIDRNVYNGILNFFTFPNNP